MRAGLPTALILRYLNMRLNTTSGRLLKNIRLSWRSYLTRHVLCLQARGQRPLKSRAWSHLSCWAWWTIRRSFLKSCWNRLWRKHRRCRSLEMLNLSINLPRMRRSTVILWWRHLLERLSLGPRNLLLRHTLSHPWIMGRHLPALELRHTSL